MDFSALIKARKVLDDYWENYAWLRGRCWGPKRKHDNPFRASNINLAEGDELVSICQLRDGKLVIHEFRKTKSTKLGRKIRKILKEQNLSLKK